MIPQLCFQSFNHSLTTANPASPSRPHPVQNPKVATYWLGFTIALVLHLLVFFSLGNQVAEQPVTPPQAIMVSWIGSASNLTKVAPSPETLARPEVIKPKTKTSTTPKPLKSQPLIAAQSDTASTSTMLEQSLPTPATALSTNTATEQTVSSSDAHAESSAEPLSLPNLNADYLDNPAPAYPIQSKQLGEQGKVFLKVLVNADGRVEQIALRKSSGHERLDDAAQDTVKNWRFVPAKRGSQTVAAWVIVPVSFSLEG